MSRRLKFLLVLFCMIPFLVSSGSDWWHSPVPEAIPFEDPIFTSDNVKDAIVEAKNTAEGFPRAGIPLINNGTQSNNDWIAYSNLTPAVKIVFPVKTKLNEVTWANSRTSVEFALEFHKNGTTAGDIFYTYTVSSGSQNYGYVDGLSYTFDAGDWIRIKYDDQGTNTSDLVVLLWISRIP